MKNINKNKITKIKNKWSELSSLTKILTSILVGIIIVSTVGIVIGGVSTSWKFRNNNAANKKHQVVYGGDVAFSINAYLNSDIWSYKNNQVFLIVDYHNHGISSAGINLWNVNILRFAEYDSTSFYLVTKITNFFHISSEKALTNNEKNIINNSILKNSDYKKTKTPEKPTEVNAQNISKILESYIQSYNVYGINRKTPGQDEDGNNTNALYWPIFHAFDGNITGDTINYPLKNNPSLGVENPPASYATDGNSAPFSSYLVQLNTTFAVYSDTAAVKKQLEGDQSGVIDCKDNHFIIYIGHKYTRLKDKSDKLKNNESKIPNDSFDYINYDSSWSNNPKISAPGSTIGKNNGANIIKITSLSQLNIWWFRDILNSIAVTTNNKHFKKQHNKLI